MNFNKHFELKGKHAFLSPSKYHWVNYTDDKLADTYRNHLAVERGVILHKFAADAISIKENLPKKRRTLNMYINDAIGFDMQSEVMLYYSDLCYGTADAISFRKNTLRIHDLKTGKTPAHMMQLMIYAALFCLEYEIRPGDIKIELRIYQNNEIVYHKPGPDEIAPIMDKIVTSDRIISTIREEEY